MSKFDKISSTAKGRDKVQKPSPSNETVPRRRGRPSGKRSDPDFVQTTSYIRSDTYKAIKIALLEEDEGQEYSELVEELLSKWLKARK
jgi:hypothetical protein